MPHIAKDLAAFEVKHRTHRTLLVDVIGTSRVLIAQKSGWQQRHGIPVIDIAVVTNFCWAHGMDEGLITNARCAETIEQGVGQKGCGQCPKRTTQRMARDKKRQSVRPRDLGAKRWPGNLQSLGKAFMHRARTKPRNRAPFDIGLPGFQVIAATEDKKTQMLGMGNIGLGGAVVIGLVGEAKTDLRKALCQ